MGLFCRFRAWRLDRFSSADWAVLEARLERVERDLLGMRLEDFVGWSGVLERFGLLEDGLEAVLDDLLEGGLGDRLELLEARLEACELEGAVDRNSIERLEGGLEELGAMARLHRSMIDRLEGGRS